MLTPESVKIRHSLVVLELAVTKIGIRGVMIEDGPSIVLNSAVILIEMARGRKADASLFSSFFALLFSCLMAGRKSGLRQVKRDLRQKKMDLEQLEAMEHDVQDARVREIVLQREKGDLIEEVRRKKLSEDELKVMVEALEAVGKERQDELREVMVGSDEVVVERKLGKGR